MVKLIYAKWLLNKAGLVNIVNSIDSACTLVLQLYNILGNIAGTVYPNSPIAVLQYIYNTSKFLLFRKLKLKS